MLVKVGFIYQDKNNDFFTPAMSGDFHIVDMWKCSVNGEVADIEENPSPVPKNTFGLLEISKNSYKYEYPEFNPLF